MSKIQVNEIVNHFDNGAPDCPRGLTVTGVSTFSGNVSIGGTLTYEDVTNIDSVGIITAQAGIRVTGGDLSIEGSASQILSIFCNDTGVQATPRTFINLYGDNTANEKKLQAQIASAPGNVASSAGELHFSTNNSSSVITRRMTINQDGEVGIGTDNPDRLLHLQAASSTAYSGGDDSADYNFLKIQNTTDDKSAGIFFQIGSNGEAAITATETSDGVTDIAFQNRGGGVRSEKMRLDGSGRLLVGTTSYAGNGKLVTAGNTGGSAGTFDICWTGSRPTAANTDIGYIRWYSVDNSSGNPHYASIYASSDGASSSGSDIPGRLVFSTTADGASSPSERLRIGSGGLISTPASSVGPTNASRGFHHGNATQSVGMTMKTLGYGSGTSNFDTGVSVNAANAGAVALLFATRNTSAGTATNGGIYIAHFYYDGNNTPAVTFLGGSNWVSWSQTASNTLQANWSGNSNFTFSMIMCS